MICLLVLPKNYTLNEGDILHLFPMVRNGSMTLAMAGSNEQTWVTYDRGVGHVVVVMICLSGGRMCL